MSKDFIMHSPLRVQFTFLQSAWRGEHDDRQGHHYYTPSSQADAAVYSSDDPGGHHASQEYEPPPFTSSTSYSTQCRYSSELPTDHRRKPARRQPRHSGESGRQRVPGKMRRY